MKLVKNDKLSVSVGSSQTNSVSNRGQWESIQLRFHVEAYSKDLLLYYSIRVYHHDILSNVSTIASYDLSKFYISTKFSHCSIISSGPGPC